jgi:hypothetical protein
MFSTLHSTNFDCEYSSASAWHHSVGWSPPSVSEVEAQPRIVFNMSLGYEWDVTVRGRIENVTDHETFPGLFQTALSDDSEISVVRFHQPTWPHTTSVIIRISAVDKKEAEKRARNLLLPVYRKVVLQIKGEDVFGWTLMVGAELRPSLGLSELGDPL